MFNFVARQHVMHAERDIVLLILSLCLSVRLSVQCRCVEMNGQIVTLFGALVAASL